MITGIEILCLEDADVCQFLGCQLLDGAHFLTAAVAFPLRRVIDFGNDERQFRDAQVTAHVLDEVKEVSLVVRRLLVIATVRFSLQPQQARNLEPPAFRGG